MVVFTTVSSRMGAFGREVFALKPGPLPRAAMLRNGAAIGAGFLTFLALGEVEAAVLCAVCTNFLCLCDRAEALHSRLWVQGIGAILFMAAAGVGGLVAGNDPIILLATFSLALFAGFVHGTLPGVEAIPRYALSCFVGAAYLQLGTPVNAVAGIVALVYSMIAIRVDHRLRHGRRGLRIAQMNAMVSYPGPRFSLIYAGAAVSGLAVGLFWGQTRPYWTTITTLLVMQPDRRANTVRVLQRFLGTIFGVVLAFAIIRIVPDAARPALLLGLIVVLPFLWPLGFDRNYGTGVALMGAWVLLMIDYATPAEELVLPVFFARLSDTAIGCAVALFGSLVVYETREETET